MKTESQYDVMDAIIAYECGTLSYPKTIQLFQVLVNTGMAWTLQGHYGRVAKDLIERGLIHTRD